MSGSSGVEHNMRLSFLMTLYRSYAVNHLPTLLFHLDVKPLDFRCETKSLYIKREIHIPLPISSTKLPNIFTYRKTLATELCYKNNRTSWGFHLLIPCSLALISWTSSEKIHFLSGKKISSSKKVTSSVSHVYIFA